MTIGAIPRELEVTAAPAQDEVDFSFRIWDLGDIVCYVDGALFSAFTVTADLYDQLDNPGGTVVFDDPFAGGEVVLVQRVLVLERASDFPSTGPVPMATVDLELDRHIAIMQDLDSEVSRAIRMPPGSEGLVLDPDEDEDFQFLGAALGVIGFFTPAEIGGDIYILPSGTVVGVTAESLGVQTYAEGVDQLAQLQAALTAAEDAGLSLLTTQRNYELWRESGLPSAAAYGGAELGCNFLYVRKPARIISVHPMGSTFNYKGPTGDSLETDFSLIDGTIYGDDKVHRGHGILLWGTASAFGAEPTDEADLPALYLENITLSTGMIADLDPAWPASAANPNAWDVTNKCIASRGDYMNGKVELHNVTFDGWFGENTYLSGMYQGGLNTFSKLIARRWTVKNTNATFINAHGPTVLDIDGMYAENCISSWESWGGWVYGRIANCTWTNINGAGFHGGKDLDSERRDDDTQPVLVVENVTIQGALRESGTPAFCYVGSFVKASNLRLIDMQLFVVGLHADQLLKNIDIDCTIECDKQSMDGAIHFYHSAGAAGCIENVCIRANLTRTDYARANSKTISGVKYQGGAAATYGPNNTIRLRGDQGGYMLGTIAEEYGGNAFHANDVRPKIIDEGLFGFGAYTLNGSSSAISFNPVASATAEFGVARLRAVFGVGPVYTAQYVLNVPALTNFNDGHEVVIEHHDSNSPLATLLIDNRWVLGYQDQLTLRANKIRDCWEVVKGENVFLGPLKVAGVIAAGNGQDELVLPRGFKPREVLGLLGTAQTGSGAGTLLTFDVNEGGVSILNAAPTFDNGERTTRTAATRSHVTDTSLAQGGVLSVDVDSIGDGTAADLQVWIIGRWTGS